MKNPILAIPKPSPNLSASQSTEFACIGLINTGSPGWKCKPNTGKSDSTTPLSSTPLNFDKNIDFINITEQDLVKTPDVVDALIKDDAGPNDENKLLETNDPMKNVTLTQHLLKSVSEKLENNKDLQ